MLSVLFLATQIFQTIISMLIVPISFYLAALLNRGYILIIICYIFGFWFSIYHIRCNLKKQKIDQEDEEGFFAARSIIILTTIFSGSIFYADHSFEQSFDSILVFLIVFLAYTDLVLHQFLLVASAFISDITPKMASGIDTIQNTGINARDNSLGSTLAQEDNAFIPTLDPNQNDSCLNLDNVYAPPSYISFPLPPYSASMPHLPILPEYRNPV